MRVFFSWKTENLYAREDAKQRNYFKRPYQMPVFLKQILAVN